MRAIRRLPLSPATDAVLRRLTAQVQGASDRRQEAQSLWKNTPSWAAAAFDEIDRTLRRMATGIDRCMYCEDSHGTDIEHFRPKGRFPEDAFTWENYLLACSHCNSNCKREAFPDVGGVPLLIDPTDPADDPHAHLRFRPVNGEFEPLPASVKAQPTIDTFDLNGVKTKRRLPEGRRDAFHTLKDLILVYRRYVLVGEAARADEVKGRICRHPFSSVLSWLIALSAKPGAAVVLDPDGAEIIDTVRVYRLDRWL